MHIISEQNFNRRAASYELNAAVQSRAAEWLAEWIEKDLTGDLQMWELGAGTGFFTRKICRHGYRVLATDIAPEMVVHGRHACPHAQWMIHDSWKLPEHVCDRLYSSSLLQWAQDIDGTLQMFRRALIPGGRMLHGFFIKPSLCEFYSIAEPYGILPLEWRSEKTWLTAFEKAELKVIRSEIMHIEETYPNALAMLKTLHGSGVTGAHGKLGAGTLRRIINEYDANFPAHSNKGVRATWAFMRVEAE